MRLIFCGALAALLASLPVVSGAAEDGKLYKWVDENGNVTYQDRPPPEDGGQVQTLSSTPAAESATTAQQPDVDVVLYAIEVCEACDLVRDLLRERRIPFEEKNAEGDVEVQSELREVAGALSVPILMIGEQVLRGYNRDLILNELEEAGFSISVQPAQAQQPASGSNRGLTREDLEGMTPEEISQAAEDAALRGEDNDLFEEDEGFATLNEDALNDDDTRGGDDVTEWEEIPEDERLDLRE
jgi:glutaredoxin